jgi:hypothetical protein
MGRKAVSLVFVVVVLGVCGASWGQKKASNPSPVDGATDVLAPLFRWTAGSTATSHNLYLGTDPNLGPAQLVGPRLGLAMFYYAPGLQPGTMYYWRVDEIEKDGVTVITGDVWTFFAQPPTAYLPEPADGSTSAPVAPALTWLAGQGSGKHHVYFGESAADVAAGTGDTDKGTVDDPTYAPGALQPTTTYFWRVDEIGLGGVIQAGSVWSFTTVLPVDDFESYNDEEKQGTRIYETWIDGYSDGSSGSTVGHLNPPFAEQTIVHSGLQSMPFDYNNINAPFFSEAKMEFSPVQDWTVNEVDTLTIHVRGGDVDFEIPRVSTPPVLDGKVDEAWLQASVQYIKTTINGAAPTGPADASGLFRVLYDADNLYVLVDVNDATLVQDSDPAQGWLDDRVEVFIDGDNSKNTAQDGQNDYQYCFRWNHGVVETPVEWYRSPASLTGVEYGVVTTASGYLLEIKLSWSTMIGVRPQAGRLIGIDVVFDDDDDGGDMDSQLAWHLPTGDPHRPNLWGTAQLAYPEAKLADRLYVALQDSANHTAVVTYPDRAVLKAPEWVEWQIPLSDFAGVNRAKVRWLYVGVGDRDNPVAGDAGRLFFDDIYLTKPAPVAP